VGGGRGRGGGLLAASGVGGGGGGRGEGGWPRCGQFSVRSSQFVGIGDRYSHSHSPRSLISGFIVRRKGKIIGKSQEVFFGRRRPCPPVFREIKHAAKPRLDPRVLAWLKSKGEGHLTRINDILTNLMEAGRRSKTASSR